MENFYIVETDNFGRDFPNERFLSLQNSEGQTGKVSFPRESDAWRVANALNFDPNGPRYFKVVKTGYELQGGFVP